mmetsp:Transcript_104509/g.300815  ORF Transcript_104509/g.300815 Transcript_104509/m.300815 type:complete len:211 (-) Transcript_104509:1577-2209(-)
MSTGKRNPTAPSATRCRWSSSRLIPAPRGSSPGTGTSSLKSRTWSSLSPSRAPSPCRRAAQAASRFPPDGGPGAPLIGCSLRSPPVCAPSLSTRRNTATIVCCVLLWLLPRLPMTSSPWCRPGPMAAPTAWTQPSGRRPWSSSGRRSLRSHWVSRTTAICAGTSPHSPPSPRTSSSRPVLIIVFGPATRRSVAPRVPCLRRFGARWPLSA